MVRGFFRVGLALVLIIVFLHNSVLFGQTDSELAFTLRFNPIRSTAVPAVQVSGARKPAAPEMRALLLFMIRLYQSYISSQDEDSCSYTKTCSRFSAEAVQRFGLLRGLLMTSDRLLRCHPLAPKYHPIDPASHLAIDLPVESYKLESPRK